MLGIDAALDGMSAELHRGTDDGAQLVTRGDLNLRFHQVHIGGHLGDGVLNLDASVHLHEGQVAFFVHEELDRPGVHVADPAERLDQKAAHPFAQLGRDLHRGCFFHQLLVAALDAAVALAQAHRVAVLIGKHLELDMPRALDELLHVEVAVAEGCGSFGVGCMKQIGQFVFAA